MAIFNPIDVAGPAHQGNQTLQKLAQGAAQNVMRRQRMRALLAQGARGARGASVGAGQPFRSSVNTRPTGLHAIPHVLGHGIGVGQGQGQGAEHANANAGLLSAGGGGYDYPSLPDPSDPTQSQSPSPPELSNTVAAPTPPGVTDPGGAVFTTPAAAGTSSGTGQQNASNPGSVDASGASGGLINLGNGLYYDPVTDSVRGGNPVGAPADPNGQRGRPV